MSKHPLSPESQRDRFIETARQLGADEDEDAFKEKLTVIARQKLKDVPDVPKRTRGTEKT